MTVSHAAEHGFHEHGDICEILLSIDNSPLISFENYSPPTCSEHLHTENFPLSFLLTTQFSYSTIRGPPIFL